MDYPIAPTMKFITDEALAKLLVTALRQAQRNGGGIESIRFFRSWWARRTTNMVFCKYLSQLPNFDVR